MDLEKLANFKYDCQDRKFKRYSDEYDNHLSEQSDITITIFSAADL